MARLEELPPGARRIKVTPDCSGIEERRPWVTGPALPKPTVEMTPRDGPAPQRVLKLADENIKACYGEIAPDRRINPA